MLFRNISPWSQRNLPAPSKGNEHPIFSLQTDMNKMFGDFFGENDDLFQNFGLRSLTDGEQAFNPVSPRIDVADSENELRISAEVPGVKEEDLKVSLSGNILTISGEKKQETREDDKGWYRMERHFGSFQRSLNLPHEIKEDKVEASYKDGILTIVCPKEVNEADKVKSIKVKKG